MNEIKDFLEFLESDKAKETLAFGESLKKLDRATERRLSFISLSSLILMTLLGYVAFHVIGAVIFFMITYISTFALKFSSKKNLLIRYLDFYRTRVPEILGDALGLKAMKKDAQSYVPSPLFEGTTLKFRVFHEFGDFSLGYAKFEKSEGVSVSEGALIICDSDLDDYDDENKPEKVKNITDKISDDFPRVFSWCEKGRAMLYLEGADYLNGRVEMKDDLSSDALTRQFKYALLAKRFHALETVDFSFDE